MVSAFKLSGLNKRQGKSGRWFVSVRATRRPVLKNFSGSKDDLARYMETTEFLVKYLVATGQLDEAVKLNKYGEEGPSLGILIAWYQSGKVQRWNKLGARTKKDYQAAVNCIMAEDLDVPAGALTTADFYRLRDSIAEKYWNKRADTLMSCLSGAYNEASKRSIVSGNPIRGIEKLQVDDPNANREWTQEEFEVVAAEAPPHLLLPYFIARYASLRGQDIVQLRRTDDQQHVHLGRVLVYTAQKNEELNFAKVRDPLAEILDTLDHGHEMMCLNSLGRPWKTENSLQRASSDFLRGLSAEGKVAPHLTLHGLRVTFASEIKRAGGTDRQVADGIGDRSESMGRRYTRGVEKEIKAAQVFKLFDDASGNKK